MLAPSYQEVQKMVTSKYSAYLGFLAGLLLPAPLVRAADEAKVTQAQWRA